MERAADDVDGLCTGARCCCLFSRLGRRLQARRPANSHQQHFGSATEGEQGKEKEAESIEKKAIRLPLTKSRANKRKNGEGIFSQMINAALIGAAALLIGVIIGQIILSEKLRKW